MKKKLANALVIIILIVTSFLICMKSPTNIFRRNQAAYTDSSVFKFIGIRMTQGDVPYLDLFDHKGILLYFINYIGTLISTNVGTWIIEFVLMFISLLSAYKLSRKFVSKPISLIIVGMAFTLIYKYFEGGNLTEEYAIPFQLIALNIFIDFFLNTKKYSNNKDYYSKLNFRLFNIPVCICGVCLACVLFLRANMISVWIVFGIMVLIYCIRNKKYVELLKFFISFICGILLVFIPILIYLVKNGAWTSFVNDYILFNMKYSSGATGLDRIAVFLKFMVPTTTMFAFIIMIIKIYVSVKNKEKYYFDIGYLAYMIVTLMLISMSGFDWAHYGLTVIPMLIYPYCIMYKSLENVKIKNIKINLILTTYILYAVILPTGLTLTAEAIQEIHNRKTPSQITANASETIKYITKNTKKDDAISVLGNHSYIYYLSNRKSASKYFYQLPIAEINTDIMDEYLNDLKQNKPKLVIFALEESYTNAITTVAEFLIKNNYILVKDGYMPIYALNE